MDRVLIKITDNCWEGKKIENLDILEDLRYFSDTSIGEMCDIERENLLVFPHSLNDRHRDIEGKDCIVVLKGNILRSSNYMGFVGRGDVELSITSRFDSGENNFFLNYMLHRVFAINLFDMKTSMDSTTIWDFLIYLFPYYLKKALRQGLFKKYQLREHNDARVRGAIDVSRHIKMNTPFAGNIAYSTREYSYDNELTQLIRHTIEYLQAHGLGGRNVLRMDRETADFVQQIITATPTYSRNKRIQTINANLKRELHPYFTEYVPLQRLCLQILRRERMSYAERKNDKIYGLVFDGAWLWEEYLATILTKEGFVHPRNKDGKGSISLFTNGRGVRYPDFYKEGIVMDAKYKWLKEYASREDVNQIVTYMHCLPARIGVLMYPKKWCEDVRWERYGTLCGCGGDIYRFFLGVSAADDYDSFVREMEEAEGAIVKLIEFCEEMV